MAKSKKEKEIPTTIDNIRDMFSRKWGDGSIMSLADNYRVKCDVIPSQSISLDAAIGVGGFPRGRIIEIYGPEASGKTTLALHAVASVQALGGKAAFIDAEHALSPQLMVDMGIDKEETLISQPDSGEQALEMCELLVQSGVVDLVVVDSVAALVPQAELEGDINANSIGAQARMMSQFLRRIASKVKKSSTAVIFINQIRHKIGVMFGSPETTPGGNALKFYASVRLDIRKRDVMKNGDVPYGHQARVKVVKNKVATPFKHADIPIIYGKGIDYEMDLLSEAAKHGVVQKSGSWFNYGETRLGQGATSATEFLKENTEITMKIKDELLPILIPDLPEDKYTSEEDIKDVDAEILEEE
jgi:recombination protein RecA